MSTLAGLGHLLVSHLTVQVLLYTVYSKLRTLLNVGPCVHLCMLGNLV